MLSLRDALVHTMDATSSSVDEVTEALVTLLVAHVISENLDPKDVIRQLRDGVKKNMDLAHPVLPAVHAAIHPSGR